MFHERLHGHAASIGRIAIQSPFTLFVGLARSEALRAIYDDIYDPGSKLSDSSKFRRGVLTRFISSAFSSVAIPAEILCPVTNGSRISGRIAKGIKKSDFCGPVRGPLPEAVPATVATLVFIFAAGIRRQ